MFWKQDWTWSALLQCSTNTPHARIPHNKDSSNQEIVDGLWFLLSAFLHRLCLSNVQLKHSRFDLVFRQSKLHNNFIFGMLYSLSKSRNSFSFIKPVFLKANFDLDNEQFWIKAKLDRNQTLCKAWKRRAKSSSQTEISSWTIILP